MVHNALNFLSGFEPKLRTLGFELQSEETANPDFLLYRLIKVEVPIYTDVGFLHTTPEKVSLLISSTNNKASLYRSFSFNSSTDESLLNLILAEFPKKEKDSFVDPSFVTKLQDFLKGEGMTLKNSKSGGVLQDPLLFDVVSKDPDIEIGTLALYPKWISVCYQPRKSIGSFCWEFLGGYTRKRISREDPGNVFLEVLNGLSRALPDEELLGV